MAPGLWHWTARHPHIHAEVSSYYLERERVAIDPLLGDEGLQWLAEHGPPAHVLLTNRHHDRDAWKLQSEFGAAVYCVRTGLYEIEGRGSVEPFDFGQELPGGATAEEVDAISPDETALYLAAHRALACADGVVRRRGDERLSFVSDALMDDPQQTKQRLREAYRRLSELDFDHLLLAHGTPVIATGRRALSEFATRV